MISLPNEITNLVYKFKLHKVLHARSPPSAARRGNLDVCRKVDSHSLIAGNRCTRHFLGLPAGIRSVLDGVGRIYMCGLKADHSLPFLPLLSLPLQSMQVMISLFAHGFLQLEKRVQEAIAAGFRWLPVLRIPSRLSTRNAEEEHANPCKCRRSANATVRNGRPKIKPEPNFSSFFSESGGKLRKLAPNLINENSNMQAA